MRITEFALCTARFDVLAHAVGTMLGQLRSSFPSLPQGESQQRADAGKPSESKTTELERENAVLRMYSDDMTDQFFAVSQENAALRDDKKLVDWLDENEASAVFEPGDPEVGLFPAWFVHYNDRELPVVHADLRAAINAARAKKGGAT
jgi:hypothetical protein